MSQNAPLAIRLFCVSHDKEPRDVLDSVTADDIEHLIQVGLGPMAYAVQARAGIPGTEALTSANLTARVIYGQLQRAAVDVLRIAHDAGMDPVLLKGISVADEFYEPAYHRIMGDIDVLVAEDQSRSLNELLLRSGFAPMAIGESAVDAEHHHLPPLIHVQTGVPVEIHHALVPRDALFAEPLLQSGTFYNEIRQSSFAGLPCRRFSIEYQIAYTLMHWAMDSKWPINVISINDFIHLMDGGRSPVDWQKVAMWMRKSPLLADLLTVLGDYLSEFGLVTVPPDLQLQVNESKRRLGTVNLRLMRWLLVTFPLSRNDRTGLEQQRMHKYVVMIWRTLLEPRHKSLRPVMALARVFRSLLRSIADRTRSLFLRSHAS